MKIKKEFLPFIIILSIICFNIPIVLLIYFYGHDYMHYFVNIVAPIQCILFGLSIIYPEYIERKEIKDKCPWTEGKIINYKLNYVNGNWLRSPNIEYYVGGKKYDLLNEKLGLSGLLFGLFRRKIIKVYYEPKNPKKCYLFNNVFFITGGFITLAGLIILLANIC